MCMATWSKTCSPDMCNVYRLKEKKVVADIEDAVNESIRQLASKLIRRSGRGPVMRQQGSEVVVEEMRWGFERGFSDSINNARTDNLKSKVWEEAYEKRRCLVPITEFYEWQPLPFDKKQPHAFRHPDEDEWLWVAGLWEPSERHGACYATLTTEPSAAMEPIHDRMLAIVGLKRGLEFLAGSQLNSTPYNGPLTITPCESPLKQKGLLDQAQGELF